MENSIIYQQSHIEIYFDEQNKYLRCVWHGTVLTEEAISAYKTGLKFMRKNDVLMWIDDFKKINLPPEEILMYIEHMWYPDAKEYGMQKHAFLVENMGFETSVFEEAIMMANRKTKIKVKFFTEMEEVEKWLNTVQIDKE
jgi:hypothetical protein